MNIYVNNKQAYTALHNLYNLQKGGGEEDFVFLSGKPGIGKSTVARNFNRKGYEIIELDQIVEDIAKDPEFAGKINPVKLFKVYANAVHDKEYGKNEKIIAAARQRLVGIVRQRLEDVIKGKGKLLIEGALRDPGAINEIFKGVRYSFYYVKPPSFEIFKGRIEKRFDAEPNEYGRMDRLRQMDADGAGMKDYKANGIKGEVIQKILDEFTQIQWQGIHEREQVLKRDFDIKIYIN